MAGKDSPNFTLKHSDKNKSIVYRKPNFVKILYKRLSLTIDQKNKLFITIYYI